MFGKANKVPASRIQAATLSSPESMAKARDIAWRKMETASSDSAYAAARAEYEALI